MREFLTYGSARGVRGDPHSYRDCLGTKENTVDLRLNDFSCKISIQRIASEYYSLKILVIYI